MERRTQAIIVLFFLSPIVGEMLSGSSPPLEFFNPFSLLILTLLYGGGALIVRELTVIWNKGWASTLVMGAAYGIIEEGLMVKSFFDPNWVDIGQLGEYGRFLDVNWVWTVMLTLFHCIFSIVIPILLVNLAYPDQAEKRWITDKGLKRLGAAFVGEVIFGFIFFTGYYPGPIEYNGAIVTVFLLFFLAHEIPAHPLHMCGRLRRPRRFYFLGALFGSGLLLTGWSVPSSGVSPLVTIWLLIALSAICFYAVLVWSNSGRDWDGRHQLALASGALSFLLFLDVILRTQSVFGMGAVAIIATLGLLTLWKNVAKRAKYGTGHMTICQGPPILP